MKLTVCLLLLAGFLGFSVSQGIAPPDAASVIRPASAQEVGADDKITKTNWQQHPKIKAVRAIVETVYDRLNKESFSMRTRKFEYCEPYEDGLRTIAIEANGRVRYYEKQAGGEDSALTWKHYYDDAGRLRFVFITGGAANGAELEHRIYFDERGKRIWEEQKYTKGEGYTFPEVWPNEQLNIRNVSKAFAAKSPCPEIKSTRAKGKRK